MENLSGFPIQPTLQVVLELLDGGNVPVDDGVEVAEPLDEVADRLDAASIKKAYGTPIAFEAQNARLLGDHFSPPPNSSLAQWRVVHTIKPSPGSAASSLRGPGCDSRWRFDDGHAAWSATRARLGARGGSPPAKGRSLPVARVATVLKLLELLFGDDSLEGWFARTTVFPTTIAAESVLVPV